MGRAPRPSTSVFSLLSPSRNLLTRLFSAITTTQRLKPYIESLQKLLRLEADKILPGHGPEILDAASRINLYISHRLLREKTILSVVQKATEPASATEETKGVTLQRVVEEVYPGLSPSLFRSASGNALLHLEKLEEEGLVFRVPASPSCSSCPGSVSETEATAWCARALL